MKRGSSRRSGKVTAESPTARIHLGRLGAPVLQRPPALRPRAPSRPGHPGAPRTGCRVAWLRRRRVLGRRPEPRPQPAAGRLQRRKAYVAAARSWRTPTSVFALCSLLRNGESRDGARTRDPDRPTTCISPPQQALGHAWAENPTHRHSFLTVCSACVLICGRGRPLRWIMIFVGS